MWRTAILPLLEEHHYGDAHVDVRRPATDSRLLQARAAIAAKRPLRSKMNSSMPSTEQPMMAPPPLVLTEGGAAQTVALTERGVPRAATARPGQRDSHARCMAVRRAAGRKVGAVTIGERQVIIRPKITDLNRLLFLLGYAKDPGIWRDEPVGLGPPTRSAARELQRRSPGSPSRAVEQGLLQGYRTITDTLPVLRGRMLGRRTDDAALRSACAGRRRV